MKKYKHKKWGDIAIARDGKYIIPCGTLIPSYLIEDSMDWEESLFTTQDGVDIFVGDGFYWVDIGWGVNYLVADASDRANFGLLFSTIEKAKEYKDKNKPVENAVSPGNTTYVDPPVLTDEKNATILIRHTCESCGYTQDFTGFRSVSIPPCKNCENIREWDFIYKDFHKSLNPLTSVNNHPVAFVAFIKENYNPPTKIHDSKRTKRETI